MTNESATSIGQALRVLMKQYGLDKKLKEVSILEYWAEIVGEKAAKSCIAQKFEHGTLTVSVSSPVWRTELQMRKPELIAKLNERIGEQMVFDIVLKF